MPEINLSIDPANVFYILMRARVVHAKTPAVNPDEGSNASDDGERPVLEDQPGDLSEQELTAALANLNEDDQLDLVALMWVGRGDYAVTEWHEARREAAAIRDRHIPRYLMETPLLSDYLEEAMDALGYSLEDEERERL